MRYVYCLFTGFVHLEKKLVLCKKFRIMFIATKYINRQNVRAEERLCRVVHVHWFSGFI